MKVIYCLDEENVLVESKLEPDNYQLKANETTVCPSEDLYGKRRFQDGKWKGESLEEWRAQHPAKPSERSIIMQLEQNNTFLKSIVMNQNQTTIKQEQEIKQLQQMMMLANQSQAISSSKEEAK